MADSPEDLHNLVMYVARHIAADDAEELAIEAEQWIAQHLGRDYPWPGNIRELEQCVLNCLVRGEYRPARPKLVEASASRGWLAQAESGTLSAEELLNHYCRWIYAQVGTYEGVAELVGLDRRTVKKASNGDAGRRCVVSSSGPFEFRIASVTIW